MELRPPEGLAKRIVSVLWIGCLALALFAQAGQSWTVFENWSETAPAFARFGLASDRQGPDAFVVAPVIPATENELATSVAVIASIDGDSVAGRSEAEVAAILAAKPDGRPVTFEVIDQELFYLTGEAPGDEDMLPATLTPSVESRDAALAAQKAAFMIASQFIDVLVAALLVAGAFMLRLRRFGEPVAMLFSFALLLLATVGAAQLWVNIGVFWLEWLIDAAWISLFLVAIPALPSGRYVPTWTRWAMVAGPVGGIILVSPIISMEIAESARLALLVLALVCVLARFRHTPSGAERQQMKWATLGLFAGLVIYAGSMILQTVSLYVMTTPEVLYALMYVQYALHRGAYLIMAAGIVVSLMDYRLNDADAAIGRSTGYALVTTLIAIVWAVSTTWINKGIGLVAGSGNPTLSTALSTLVALAVLTPARTRVMAWTENRFQRALVRLRSLPGRLAKWQHGDDPEPVAQAALAALIDGVNARRAAIVSLRDGVPHALATYEASPEAAEAAAVGQDPEEGTSFILRLPLREGQTVVGWLLLGERSDGAAYSGDERAAVKSVLDPLADAIRFTSRRAETQAAFNAVIAAMEERVARVEAERLANVTPSSRRRRKAAVEA